MSGSTAKAKRKQDAEQSGAQLPRLTETEAAEFQAAYDAQQTHHASWDEKEKLLINQTADSVSAQFSNKVSDGRLSTIVIERAARVMAQTATGVVRALTKKNRGLGQLMSLFLTRYVQPNDNFQFSHLTKLRLIDMYSQVYGTIPVMYDISVTEDYLGPGSAILPIRSWYPQKGKLSIDDSDHNHVETTVSLRWLKDQKGKGSWDAKVINHIERLIADEDGKASVDQNQRSVREKEMDPNYDGTGQGDAAPIRLITRYENGSKGRWKTFLPDYENLIARDCQSKDGHIPIILKHHIPLIDSIYGLGAFERGKTLQYAMDSLVAMYMAGVQMSIFPPRIIRQNGVVKSSLEYGPGATWIETIENSIRNYTVSPDGLSTFQSTYGWLTGSLLNQNGTSDTSQTRESTNDPSAGRTPQALKMQAQRESAADAWDASMMEQFQEKLYERMINIAHLTPKPFTFHIFDAEIKQIQESGLKDVMDIFESEKEAKITLPSSKLKNVNFKFIIDAGTNLKTDQEAEHMVYKELIDGIIAAPQLIAATEADGYKIHIGEIIHQYFITGGAKDVEKLISKVEAPMAAEGAPVPAAPGAPAEGAGAEQMMQIMSGQPAPAPQAPPPPPDETKNPDHQLILALLDKLDAPSLRKVIQSVGLPADGILPMEAKIAADLIQPEDPTGAQGAQLVEIDPESPYGAAKDPHAHLNASQDPAVKQLYGALTSSLQQTPAE